MKNDFWLACLALLVVIVPLLLAWFIVSLPDQIKRRELKKRARITNERL
ncbi:hypothetical protein YS110_14905 [Acidovorax sp. YS12]|jgi:hypothetical protein|nr:hypothetical protein YS110_14905 [Acidovorax sp. YS12]